MPEAKLRENHARLDFLTHQMDLLLKQFGDMRTELKTIEGDVDYEKKQIDSAEELTFKFGLDQQKNFEEVKNELNTLIDHQEHHNIQKELAVVYGFDKTLNHRHLKILNCLLSKYNNQKKEFQYSNFNQIQRDTHTRKNDLNNLLKYLVEKSLIEFSKDGRKSEYRCKPKLNKDEIKAVETEMEKELS